ncbi:hypothetical protein [Bacteroides finegoldii]|uniref:hypothetical protein n=1 Tax=Bacteroides finegoldii TaxID=338188 RepID=UPI00189D148B|nr:hypothetical protein [Bacteroides finegoldii]
MKKFLSITLLLTAMFFTLSSCSKDDEKEEVHDTTYTFTYTGDNPPQGIICDFTLFEYNDKGERVAQNHVRNCRKGTVMDFVAKTNSQKVKVYYVQTKGTQTVAKWIQQVYYLEKGENVKVAVTGETRVGTTEP